MIESESAHPPSRLLSASTVLFDLDGTLADTVGDLVSALNRVRADHGLAPVSIATLRAHASSGARGMLGAGLGVGPDDDGYRDMRDAFLDYYAKGLADTTELFDGIDSLDSLRLAERLNEAAGRLGKRLPVLIEVKLSSEETKSGIDPESAEAAELLERLPDLEHLRAQGLMTIAPWGVAEDVTRSCFRSLREWRDRWAALLSR